MPRGIKKQHLFQKLCAACNRAFSWRKKWEKVWGQVKHCSKHCEGKS